MGQAKRRRLAGESALPEDLKRDIAAAVRSVNQYCGSGIGFLRTVCGSIVLQKIGMKPATRAYGSLIYCAGPDPIRDVIALCGKGNRGTLSNELRGFQGHSWVECDGDLIDFSSGDWIAQAAELEACEFEYCQSKGITYPGATQFQIKPPEYIWQKSAPLKSLWKRFGNPGLGEFWYGPLSKGCTARKDFENLVAGVVETTTTGLIEVIQDFHLPKRVAEWTAGR